MSGEQLFKFAAAAGCTFHTIGGGGKKDFAGLAAITAYIFEDRHIHSPL